ncbi:TetR/AcrR family transcriptional regulator [Sphingorhabdus arenilitoris]|uniref:TetR/AcrR family transcriptional regulator n=1 Tax=Sphingorhabdus arenilitoris TaxID=1490041 RepID=A0ABV8REC5_9SPHN
MPDPAETEITPAPKTGQGRPVDTSKSAAIIKAARDQFFKIGFAQTSIESVAAQASVSKVTVYNRFGTKEALFEACVEAECNIMRDSLSIEDMVSGDLRATLVGFGMNMIAFLSRDEMTRFERHLAVEAEHNPDIGTLFLNAGPRRLHGALSALLDQAVAAGKLTIDDTALAAEHLAGMIKGLADLERRFGQDDPDHFATTQKRVNSAVDLFLKGYGRSAQ